MGGAETTENQSRFSRVCQETEQNRTKPSKCPQTTVTDRADLYHHCRKSQISLIRVVLYSYCRTSLARTLMARLPRLFRTAS